LLTKVVMPQVSITTAEVTLSCWLKKVGEKVTRGEPMLTVETDKATMDVEAYIDGYLRQTFFQDGDVVPIDAVIAIITSTPDEPLPEEVEQVQEAAAPRVEKATPPAPAAPARTPAAGGRIVASPIARKLAEEHGIELTTLIGSGPGGRIMREDVEAALQAREAAGAPAAPGLVSSGMRKAIAERTVFSNTTLPHYYVSIDLDMSAALEYVAQAKQHTANADAVVPTITDLLIWACGQIIPHHPSVNASWKDGGIEYHKQVNIGLVVGLEEGLMVPVVHNASALSISQIAGLTAKLKQKAAQGTLSMSELTGGTFTISNLGMFGISSFIAVINPPESVILALASIQKRVVVTEEGSMAIKPIMTANLSSDHRIVDGIKAAKFLNELRQVLLNLVWK
jgi:pyruvate dehydrogenase E2 component (dihydrolipoamide acetyltransferase)